MPHTYAIIGVGGLGGFYGARLHHAGFPTRFLFRSDFGHVKAHGLRVDSKHGDLSISADRLAAYADPRDMPPCDVVLLCLKTTQNHLLPEVLPHVVKDGGVVVMMQNGLNVEADAARIVGPDRVMSGLSFLCSSKIGPGHIHHQDYGQVRLGDYSATGEPRGVTTRMRHIAADFERAGIPVELEEDLILARWKKLVWNVPYNGLTVVLNATTQQLMGDPQGRSLCIALMREVAAGAAALGRHIEPAFIQTMVAYTDRMVPYRPSMKVDYDSGRPLEVEAIYGEPVREAERAGVGMPRVRMLYEQLKLIEVLRLPAPAEGVGGRS